MTPKEKAEEIYSKFVHMKSWCDDAQECALIVVDEIIDAIKHEDNRMYYEIKYWEEVKQEIENL